MGSDDIAIIQYCGLLVLLWQAWHVNWIGRLRVTFRLKETVPCNPAPTSRTSQLLLKAKVRIAQGVLDLCFLLSLLVLVVLCLIDPMRFTDRGKFCAWMTFLNAVCWLSQSVIKDGLTAYQVDSINTILHIGLVIRVATGDLAHLLELANGRLCLRILLGFMFLDSRKVLAWNMVVSVVTSLRFVHSGTSTFASNALALVAMELFTSLVAPCTILVIRYLIEILLQEHLQASDSESSLQAARKLLSVLCDAEMHLGPDLQIMNPSRKLAHFLGFDENLLHRLSFESFIPPKEVSKIQSVLRRKTCMSPQEDVPSLQTPSSTNIMLRPAKGTPFNARFYHTYLPSHDDAEPAGHLICFCHMDPDGDCASLHLAPNNVEQSEQSEQSADDLRWRVLQAEAARQENASELSDDSSSQSSSSQKQLQDYLNIRDMSMSFNPFSHAYEMHECSIKFKSTDRHPNSLLNWFQWSPLDSRKAFRKWIKAAVRNGIRDRAPPPLDCHLAIHMPFMPRGLTMMPRNVSLYLEEADAEEEEEEVGKPYACIELNDIHVQRLVRSRSQTSGRKGVESTSSEQLNCIDEVASLQ